jgi:hypothetical protein
MFFRDVIADPEQWKQYEALLADYSCFVNDAARFLADAAVHFETHVAPQGKEHHSAIFFLMRHMVETVDGVSILVGKGSSENCGGLLRSAFEGLLQLLYVLEADEERRALAYLLGYAHRRIKSYQRYDKTDPLGAALRREMVGDPFLSMVDNRLNLNWKPKIANLEGMCRRQPFAPIEAEWQRVKKTRGNRDPEWYALFNGPTDIRSLAKYLKRGGVYEVLYRDWSEFIHASGGMKNVARGSDGNPTVRPIRHPEGIEQACQFAYVTCGEAAQAVVQKYDAAGWTKWNERLQREFGTRLPEMMYPKIKAEWR